MSRVDGLYLIIEKRKHAKIRPILSSDTCRSTYRHPKPNLVLDSAVLDQDLGDLVLILLRKMGVVAEVAEHRLALEVLDVGVGLLASGEHDLCDVGRTRVEERRATDGSIIVLVVLAIRISSTLEEKLDHLLISAVDGLAKRGDAIVDTARELNVGTVVEEVLDDLLVAVSHCLDERGKVFMVVHELLVDVGTSIDEELDGLEVARLGGVVERGASQGIGARIGDVCATTTLEHVADGVGDTRLVRILMGKQQHGRCEVAVEEAVEVLVRAVESVLRRLGSVDDESGLIIDSLRDHEMELRGEVHELHVGGSVGGGVWEVFREKGDRSGRELRGSLSLDAAGAGWMGGGGGGGGGVVVRW